MAIRDYWVYQNRNVEKPWVLYIVKEYDKRVGKQATCLDYTLYHEDIPNSLHANSEVCVHYDTLTGYLNHLLCAIMEWSSVNHTDEKHLRAELSKILSD